MESRVLASMPPLTRIYGLRPPEIRQLTFAEWLAYMTFLAEERAVS